MAIFFRQQKSPPYQWEVINEAGTVLATAPAPEEKYRIKVLKRIHENYQRKLYPEENL